MSTAHVFAADWVPAATDIASSQGLRSLQIIEALRDAGCAVTYSVPRDCRHLQRVGRDNPAVRDIELHDTNNQIDLLRKHRPRIVVWLSPLVRSIPFTGSGDLVHVCDLIGLQHLEASSGIIGQGAARRERLVRLSADADLILTGSEEQNGYWLAELSQTGTPPPTAVVPYALPRSMPSHRPGAKSSLNRLHVTSTVYAGSASADVLERVANWVAARDEVTLSLILKTDPGGPPDLPGMQQIQRLARELRVEIAGERPFSATMADYGGGSVALDIRESDPQQRMLVPIRTVNALTNGIPIVSTVDGTLMRRLIAAGAGVIATDLSEESIETKLSQIAGLSAADLNRMSKAAFGFARKEYDPATAAQTLAAAVADASGRHGSGRRSISVATRGTGAEVRPPHVLVISDAEPHHRELRVEIPFNALFGHQQIAGYSVWSRGDFRFSTSSNLTDQPFDAIWVQHDVSPEVAVALNTLNLPFVYDIDDNRLVSQRYRLEFSIEQVQTAHALIRSCLVLSCSTTRLGQLLNSAFQATVIDKVIVTPSLVRDAPPARPTGVPRFLIWAPGATFALSSACPGIIEAIRDFCLARDLRMICFGAEPPDLIADSDVEVRQIRQVPYGSYVTLLRSLAPAIMACPLETEADAAAADFTSGESDLKILEALAGGVVGVFSRALPYLESDLPQPIMCENSYRGWMEGMGLAWRQSEHEPTSAPLPPNRTAAAEGVLPWLDAVEMARLPESLSCQAFKDSLLMLRGRYGRRLLSDPEFDLEFYLTTYPDVQVAMQQRGLPSAYEHYRLDGFREGRKGRPNDNFEGNNELVWTTLLQTLGGLRTSADRQAADLEALRVLRETRQAFRRKPAG